MRGGLVGEKRAEVVGVVCGLAGGGGGGSVGGLRRVGRGGMVGGGLHRKKMWNSGWVCDCRGIGVCGGGSDSKECAETGVA